MSDPKSMRPHELRAKLGLTGEKMAARLAWAKLLTQLANDFPAANTDGSQDRKVQLALAMLVGAATRAGL